jgi:hypothetical protein
MTRRGWWAGGIVVLALAALAIGWASGRRSGRAEVREAGDSRAASRTPAPARPRSGSERPRPAVPAGLLERDLADPDPVVRGRALHSGAGDDATVVAAVRDPDLSVSAIAAEQLVRRYRDGAFSTRELTELYQDRSLGLKPRIAILNGLADQPDDQVGALLEQALARGATVEERRAAANLIAFQDPALAIPALVAALGDDDQWVRSNARDSLRQLANGRDFGEDAAAWTAWWGGRPR